MNTSQTLESNSAPTTAESVRSYTPLPVSYKSRADHEPFLTLGDIAAFIRDPSQNGGSETLMLYDGGCRVGSKHDCSHVCSNSTLIFSSHSSTEPSPVSGDARLSLNVPYNLFNCMYYPYIVRLLRDESADPEALFGAKATAANFNIIDDATDEHLGQVETAISACFLSWCAQSKDCVVGSDGKFIVQQGPGMAINSSLGHGFPDWSTISPASSMSIMSDIGGIGISIAYMIQFTVMMLAWLWLSFLRLRRSRLFISLYRLVSRRARTLPVVVRATPFRTRTPSSQRQWSTLLSSMSDFQKAQCFFLIPLNIAILIALGGSRQIVLSTSLGQLLNNLAYINVSIQGGTTFATFTIFCIHAAGHKSPYLCLLSLAAVLLGTAAWASSQNIKNPDLLNITLRTDEAHDPWIRDCGPIPPSAYNGRVGNVWSPSPADIQAPSAAGVRIAGNCTLMVVLCLDLYFHKTLVKPITVLIRILNVPDTDRVQNRIVISIQLLIEITMVVSALFFITDYQKFMDPTLPTIDKSFTIGQLMAIAIWIPSIIDWIRAAAVGLERASLHRIVAPFKVVQSKPQTISGDPNSSSVMLIATTQSLPKTFGQESTGYRRVGDENAPAPHGDPAAIVG